MSYFEWRQIFESKIVKFFSWVTVFSLISHAWIGIHCVISDYITVRLIGPKALVIRKIFMSFDGYLGCLFPLECLDFMGFIDE